jgi:MFS family permease
MPPATLLLLVSASSLVAVVAGVLLSDPLLATVAFFVLGLSYAGLTPLSYTIGSSQYPHRSGVMSGLMWTAGAMASVIAPWASGLIGDRMGLRSGLWVYVAASAVLVVAAVAVRRLVQAAHDVPQTGVTVRPDIAEFRTRQHTD